MSLTDVPKQQSIDDVYPPGTPFRIILAWVEGVVDTQFGKRTLAKAVVEPATGGQAIEFSLWGSLCEQVQAIEDGDVPGVFAIGKDGNKKLFVAAVDPNPPETAASEQALMTDTPAEAAQEPLPAGGAGQA